MCKNHLEEKDVFTASSVSNRWKFVAYSIHLETGTMSFRRIQQTPLLLDNLPSVAQQRCKWKLVGLHTFLSPERHFGRNSVRVYSSWTAPKMSHTPTTCEGNFSLRKATEATFRGNLGLQDSWSSLSLAIFVSLEPRSLSSWCLCPVPTPELCLCSVAGSTQEKVFPDLPQLGNGPEVSLVSLTDKWQWLLFSPPSIAEFLWALRVGGSSPPWLEVHRALSCASGVLRMKDFECFK